jgi:hypothetical protein
VAPATVQARPTVTAARKTGKRLVVEVTRYHWTNSTTAAGGEAKETENFVKKHTAKPVTESCRINTHKAHTCGIPLLAVMDQAVTVNINTATCQLHAQSPFPPVTEGIALLLVKVSAAGKVEKVTLRIEGMLPGIGSAVHGCGYRFSPHIRGGSSRSVQAGRFESGKAVHISATTEGKAKNHGADGGSLIYIHRVAVSFRTVNHHV